MPPPIRLNIKRRSGRCVVFPAIEHERLGPGVSPPGGGAAADVNLVRAPCCSPVLGSVLCRFLQYAIADRQQVELTTESRSNAKVVCHGRCVIVQMAEYAVPKESFQEVLRLINGLRQKPAPKWQPGRVGSRLVRRRRRRCRSHCAACL